MAEGIDYSYGSGLTADAIRKAGKVFVCRYLATLPNSKCITGAEAANLLGAGLKVVLVWETVSNRILSGHAGGTADAREADRQATALGMRGIPLYFACDFDAAEAQQGAINDYLRGAASVISLRRTGLYGGYWPVSRAFTAKVITYGWQTYAWSGGHWDTRAQLQQYRNGVRLGPADVDYDRSTTADYGQWPRPGAVPPAAPAATWQEWETRGHTSLQQVADACDHMTPASVLRRTAQHYKAGYDAVISTYINDVFAGRLDVHANIPAGGKLWVRK